MSKLFGRDGLEGVNYGDGLFKVHTLVGVYTSVSVVFCELKFVTMISLCTLYMCVCVHVLCEMCSCVSIMCMCCVCVLSLFVYRVCVCVLRACVCVLSLFVYCVCVKQSFT